MSSTSPVRATPTIWSGMRCASCRRATPHRAPATRRCWKSAALRTRFLLESDATQAYACVPLAHLVECRPDKQVVLDDSFIPTVLHARTANRLATLTSRACSGCFISAAKRSADGWRRPARGAAAEFADFLMLQAINRYEPLLAHYADSGALHPEELYQVCVSAAGELATFTTTSKRPPKFPGLSARPPARVVRAGDRGAPGSLSKVLTQSAISIPLEPQEVRHQCGDRDRP